MAKIYTAQEMRDAADLREAWGDKDEVNNMLRQAADMIEREARREKEYEYSLKMASGRVTNGRFSDEETARRFAMYGDTVVRREVGVWKEVKECK